MGYIFHFIGFMDILVFLDVTTYEGIFFILDALGYYSQPQ